MGERKLFDSKSFAFKNYSEEFDKSCSVGLEGTSNKCLQYFQAKKLACYHKLQLPGKNEILNDQSTQPNFIRTTLYISDR